MTTLRIYGSRNQALTFDLRDLIDLLAPRSLDASWTVAPVTISYPVHGFSINEFMMTGSGEPGHDKLEQLAASGSSISGGVLLEAAREARQVIWGQFTATLPEQSDAWVIIRAIDSTFYEVTSSDEAVLNAIRSICEDVRVAPGPVASAPIEPVRKGEV
jgi:hypothetical protein